ncbi:YraN family protein [Catenovulum sp. SX2]|uniref:YraN family protein n=1 Tax=Catenovulum sp. SX2 TaxID=3398614 RepID=UPI003F8549F2
MNKRQIGEQYEQAAANLLAKQGIICIARNFNCKMGEIDLICRDNNCFVFVEVRFRQQNNYGSAAATVSYAKQRKVQKAAMFFLKQQGLNIHHTEMRFDVVSFDFDVSQPNWIKSAF